MNTNGKPDDIGARKARHLEICIEEERYAVEFGSNGLDGVKLLHRALPELDADRVDTSTTFLGTRVSLPLFISSMTGGSAGAYDVNKALAKAACRANVPVGMGSIRILYRRPEVLPDFQLKRVAPDVPVFANIGGAQVRDVEHRTTFELLARLEVDAVAVHLNPGQELIQPEGDRDFAGIFDAVAAFCERCPVPVIVKETGFGIRPDEALRLIGAGARYVDVAGGGGTNWITVEAHRFAEEDRPRYDAAREFDTWGTPTAVLLAALDLRTRARKNEGDAALLDRILASGGLRTGMDLVRAIALGAQLAGFALPFVRAFARGGEEAVDEQIARYAHVLRTAMTLVGARTVADLRKAPLSVSRDFENEVASYTAALGMPAPRWGLG